MSKDDLAVIGRERARSRICPAAPALDLQTEATEAAPPLSTLVATGETCEAASSLLASRRLLLLDRLDLPEASAAALTETARRAHEPVASETETSRLPVDLLPPRTETGEPPVAAGSRRLRRWRGDQAISARTYRSARLASPTRQTHGAEPPLLPLLRLVSPSA